jgi:hypothetical protein
LFALSSCAPAAPPPQTLTPDSIERHDQIQTYIDQGEYQQAINASVELYDIGTSGVMPQYQESVIDPLGSSVEGLTTVNPQTGDIQILISQQAMMDAERLISTIAHEGIHAEQYYGGRWYLTEEGRMVNEIEAYARVLDMADYLELSITEMDSLNNSILEYWKKSGIKDLSALKNNGYRINAPSIPTPAIPN